MKSSSPASSSSKSSSTRTCQVKSEGLKEEDQSSSSSQIGINNGFSDTNRSTHHPLSGAPQWPVWRGGDTNVNTTSSAHQFGHSNVVAKSQKLSNRGDGSKKIKIAKVAATGGIKHNVPISKINNRGLSSTPNNTPQSLDSWSVPNPLGPVPNPLASNTPLSSSTNVAPVTSGQLDNSSHSIGSTQGQALKPEVQPVKSGGFLAVDNANPNISSGPNNAKLSSRNEEQPNHPGQGLVHMQYDRVNNSNQGQVQTNQDTNQNNQFLQYAQQQQQQQQPPQQQAQNFTMPQFYNSMPNNGTPNPLSIPSNSSLNDPTHLTKYQQTMTGTNNFQSQQLQSSGYGNINANVQPNQSNIIQYPIPSYNQAQPKPLNTQIGAQVSYPAPSSNDMVNQQYHSNQYVQNQSNNVNAANTMTANSNQSLLLNPNTANNINGTGRNLNASAPMRTNQGVKPKQKIVLSQAARTALTYAVVSSLKSLDGSIDERAMANALAAGLPRSAVINAAKAAAARQALKLANKSGQRNGSVGDVKRNSNSINATVQNGVAIRPTTGSQMGIQHQVQHTNSNNPVGAQLFSHPQQSVPVSTTKEIAPNETNQSRQMHQQHAVQQNHMQFQLPQKHPSSTSQQSSGQVPAGNTIKVPNPMIGGARRDHHASVINQMIQERKQQQQKEEEKKKQTQNLNAQPQRTNNSAISYSQSGVQSVQYAMTKMAQAVPKKSVSPTSQISRENEKNNRDSVFANPVNASNIKATRISNMAKGINMTNQLKRNVQLTNTATANLAQVPNPLSSSSVSNPLQPKPITSHNGNAVSAYSLPQSVSSGIPPVKKMTPHMKAPSTIMNMQTGNGLFPTTSKTILPPVKYATQGINSTNQKSIVNQRIIQSKSKSEVKANRQKKAHTPVPNTSTSSFSLKNLKPLPPLLSHSLTGSFKDWKRLQSGLFIHDENSGKMCMYPGSMGAIFKSDYKLPAIHENSTDDKNWISLASRIRSTIIRKQQINSAAKPVNKNMNALSTLLLDPNHFKRFKIQPKKEGKSLEKTLRKTRSNTCKVIVKKHKNFLKAIVTHQSDFFKFHRIHRTEISRLARSVRDHVDKTAKKKERNAELAERARLAALRANDMQAYSTLLEETKNERLKFLLGKTDEYIDQISGLLSKERGEATNSLSSPASSKGSYYATAHVNSEEICQPSILVGGDLKEYQLAGLQWMVSLYNNKLNGILADEMGLGKTIQTIALLAYLIEVKENRGPFLVIVPLSTLSNWVNEFGKWCPAALVIAYKGNPQHRKELFREEVSGGHFNVLLTTYEYIIKDKASLKKIPWQYAIVDEGHRMKNAQSKFAVVLGTKYSTRHRILLTGTPLQNNLPELWALLNFLLPSIFNSVENFDQWFNRPFAQFGSSAAGESNESSSQEILSNEERMLIIHRLHELLRPFMLRRVKSEVLDQLPQKIEKVLRCELSSWQKYLYQQISANASAASGLATQKTDTEGSRGMNNVVMQLRKVCNHPYLFSPEGYHTDDNIIRSSGKIELLDRMLPKLKAAGHRVLMFTQMTAVMTILEDYFYYRGYLSLRLDGSTPAEEREKRMYKFNAPDSPYFIFLLSTRAGGLGLNLASADTVIIFDSDWNPMMDLQAADRAHRIGQRNSVRVFRLISYSPVEEKILSRATEKLNMSEIVVEAGKFDKRSVEEDNSHERRKMMEILLTDFDTTTTNAMDESDSQEGEETEIVDEFNEMISSNDEEYDLYCTIDDERKSIGLLTDPNDIPDWIKYPKGKKKSSTEKWDQFMAEDNGVKRKRNTTNTVYDDGLTESQFVKMMEKQAAIKEETERMKKEERIERRNEKNEESIQMSKDKTTMPNESEFLPGSAESDFCQVISDEINHKLISACKVVIALRESTGKRRLSEIFLEKPCPRTYPDYYKIIKKPISINEILKKCRARKYNELKEFWADWKLLFENARQYNEDGSWVVVDAGLLQAELKRYMEKNGLYDEASCSKSDGLRIRLTLKKTRDVDSESKSSKYKGKKKRSNDDKCGNERPSKRSRSSTVRKSDNASISSQDDNDLDVNELEEKEPSIFSDVLGMEERVVDRKKRGKNRGSRFGKGSYGRRKSSD